MNHMGNVIKRSPNSGYAVRFATFSQTRQPLGEMADLIVGGTEK